MADDNNKKNEEQQNPEQSGQLNIELSEEVAEGTYSNLAIINHSNAEFVIDFIKVLPGTPKAKVKSRILLTPQHAKRLLRALGENVSKFESQHGTIEEPKDPGPGQGGSSGTVPFSFGGPTGQA